MASSAGDGSLEFTTYLFSITKSSSVSLVIYTLKSFTANSPVTFKSVDEPEINDLPLSKSKTTPSSLPEKEPPIKTPDGMLAPETEESVNMHYHKVYM